MKLDVTEQGAIRLREVYNSLTLETAEGNQIYICMRDDTFEIGVPNLAAKNPRGEAQPVTWYRVSDDDILPMLSSTTMAV